GVEHVAGDDRRAVAPGRDRVRTASHAAHLLAALFEQPQQAATDVAGCPGQQDTAHGWPRRAKSAPAATGSPSSSTAPIRLARSARAPAPPIAIVMCFRSGAIIGPTAVSGRGTTALRTTALGPTERAAVWMVA